MAIYDQFKDIIKHTYGLGFIDMVKVTGTEDGALIQAMDENRTVVINGKLNGTIDGIENESVVGLSRIGVLNGYLNFYGDRSEVNIVSQERQGETIPAEISFKSKSGSTGNYRFMTRELANEQIQVPPFRGAEWALSITPTKQGMDDLAKVNGILGSFENAFTVRTNGDKLEFHIGTSSTDRTKLIFAEGIDATLKHAWSWPTAQVLSILKLHETSASTTMRFSDIGALQIEVDSGTGVFTYILPARTS